MDLLLENGDFKKNSNGKPMKISGLEELKQQIYIRLKTRLGSFIYDRSLGSEITANTESNKLTELIQKALPQLFDAELLSSAMADNVLVLKFNSELGAFTLEIPFEDEEE